MAKSLDKREIERDPNSNRTGKQTFGGVNLSPRSITLPARSVEVDR